MTKILLTPGTGAVGSSSMYAVLTDGPEVLRFREGLLPAIGFMVQEAQR